MSPTKRRGLGRGLDALLTSVPKDSSENSSNGSHEQSELQKLPIEQLHPGK